MKENNTSIKSSKISTSVKMSKREYTKIKNLK